MRTIQHVQQLSAASFLTATCSATKYVGVCYGL